MDRSSFFTVWSDRLLSVLRIVLAGLFVQHGTAKLFHIPHVAQFDHVQLMSLAGVAGVIEVVFGLLLLVQGEAVGRRGAEGADDAERAQGRLTSPGPDSAVS